MKYSLKTSLTIALIAALTFGSLAPVQAQSQEKPVPPSVRETKAPDNTVREPGLDNTGRRTNVITSGDDEYKIGAGDVIDIRIVDAEELSGSFRVRADGTIKLHFLGRLVVLDKTSEDVAKEIADGLRGKYLFEPRVSVDVTELTSKAIYIQGAVSKPAVYQIEGHPHLMQALVMAGGLLPNHGTTAFIIRRNKVSEEDIKAHEAALREENEKAKKEAADKAAAEKAAAEKGEVVGQKADEKVEKPTDEPRLLEGEWLAKQYTLVKININGLFKGAFDQNMFLQPGDIINIPSTDMFFVSGQVKAPGSFALKEGTTLRQALALSQGFTSTASPGKGIIFRENPETGKRTELAIDMGAIMAGKKEDVAVYANDVILVPNSGFKTFALPLIQTASMTILTALLFRAISY